MKFKRILIIEEDNNIALLLTDLLARFGACHFERVSKHVDGIRILCQKGARLPDLVLMDLGTTLPNGNITAGWMKRQEHLKSIPIILMSIGDPRSLGKIGIDAFFLPKPIMLQGVCEALSVLEKSL